MNLPLKLLHECKELLADSAETVLTAWRRIIRGELHFACVDFASCRTYVDQQFESFPVGFWQQDADGACISVYRSHHGHLIGDINRVCLIDRHAVYPEIVSALIAKRD